MTCTKLPLAGGGVATVCTRGRRPPKCSTDGKPAGYICDGCDGKLCDGCRLNVMHTGKERDFCPTCFRVQWGTWLQAGKLGHLPPVPVDRLIRREAFRTWAKRNPEFFANLPLTRAGAR